MILIMASQEAAGMTEVLHDMSEATLVRAVEANLTAFHVFLSEWPEITLHRDDDRIWTVSHRRFSLCNVLLEAHFDAARMDAQIETALAPYLPSNVNIMWKLGPSTRPGNLGDRLVDRGFVVRPTLAGMALDLTTLDSSIVLPPGFEAREVVDSRTLELWREALGRGFGWPGYGAEDVADNLAYFLGTDLPRSFVAYVGTAYGAPVASSLGFFGAGVAGIYHVSTVPDHRGRGLGSIITKAPLIEARRRGYRVAVLHATEMGYPVYRRLGFEEVCPIGLRLHLDESRQP
jgi:GNAT superfamily N-acetyltransferase